MSSGTKATGIVVLAAVVIGASVWLGRQNQSKPVEPSARPEHTQPGAESPKGTTPVAVSRTNDAKPVTVATNPQIESVTTATTNPAAAAATAGLITDWNEKIDDALKSGAEEREVAKSLLKLFPKFPPEGQVDAVQHISNLLPDEDYPELAKLMEDAKLPEDVLDQLIMDLLNRPNKIMLPELVKVAKNAEHPKAGEAKDFLELYLEEDYGADWNLWQTKVDEWLKANPD